MVRLDPKVKIALWQLHRIECTYGFCYIPRHLIWVYSSGQVCFREMFVAASVAKSDHEAVVAVQQLTPSLAAFCNRSVHVTNGTLRFVVHVVFRSASLRCV